MDAHFQATALVGEVRLQPGDRQDFVIGRLRQDKAAAAGTSISTILVTVTSPIRHFMSISTSFYRLCTTALCFNALDLFAANPIASFAEVVPKEAGHHLDNNSIERLTIVQMVE
jgi:hypothetical protein